jgi:site-specific recombinase XerD
MARQPGPQASGWAAREQETPSTHHSTRQSFAKRLHESGTSIRTVQTLSL